MKYVHGLVLAALCGVVAPSAVSQSSHEQTRVHFAQLPISFQANSGQSDPRVKFLAQGQGYSLFLTENEAAIALNGTQQNTGRAIVMQLLGVHSAKVMGIEDQPGKANYFIGNNPSKWRTNVPSFAKVEYQGVYPGVDLVYRGNQEQLEYDFVLAPGADPSAIRLKFRGAGKLRVEQNGDLTLGLTAGEVRFEKPVVYQMENGQRKIVEAGYVLQARDRVGFHLGPYDHDKELVIDPVLVYSTYLGGTGSDSGLAIATDSTGNAYVTGRTTSTDFPVTAGAFQTTSGGSSDVFVSKLSADGSTLVYSTYVGGSADDSGSGIAVDSFGNAYFTGYTSSSDFPTISPFQSALHGTQNAFVAKLSSTGSSLIYATYLGGTNTDQSNGIAVGASGNAYITGGTSSPDFPTTGSLQPYASSSGGMAFISELSIDGTSLVYSTFLGGTSTDTASADTIAKAITVDGTGNAFVTGSTSSPSFYTLNPLQASLGGASATNAFVSKLNAGGASYAYSTYLGGNGSDSGQGIAVDAAGNVYVTGYTSSANFPVQNAVQATLAGTQNAFVSKLNANGSALVYSTYLGGSGSDAARAISVDGAGNAYIAGETNSANFPTSHALQASLAGAQDAFVAELNAVGSALVYSSYLGGSGADFGTSVSVDSAGNARVTGYTLSSDFPVASALQATVGGGAVSHGFVAEISALPGPAATLVSSTNPANLSQSVTFTVTVNSPGGGAPAPTGSITFRDGVTPLATVALSGSGQAEYSTSALSLGTHSIVAVYGGDANYAGSVSPVLNQDVSTLQSITVSLASGSVPAGQSVQATATGSYADGSSGDVTDVVTWASSNHDIAKVSNTVGSQGLITGVVTGGPVAISATEGAISGSASLTVTPPQPPTVVSLSPNSGSGAAQTFTVVVNDPSGLGDLNQIQLMFNSSATRLLACNVYYFANTHTIALYNEVGSGFVGSVTPGVPSSVSNNECTLNGAGSSYTSSGNNFTLNVSLSFSGSFVGPQNSYAYVQGNNGLNNGGWQLMGSWTVPNQNPTIVSLSPSAGTGVSQTFTVVVTDPSGLSDLNQIQILVNNSATRTSGCSVFYNPATNSLSLYNDIGSAFLAPVLPGSTSQASNGQCTLSGVGSSYSSTGNTVTLGIALSFSGSFAGQKNLYAYAQGNNGLNTGGWVNKGTWTVPTQSPSVVSVSPNSGSGTTQTFTVVANDPSGISDLNQIQLLFNTSTTRLSGCNVYYHADTHAISLYNDGGSGFAGSVTPGVATSVSNSQCTLNGAGSSYGASGNYLTLNVALTFKTFGGAFTGQKNVYAYVQGNNGLNSGGWVQEGTWTPPAQPPTIVSLNPVSGSGDTQIFTVVASDPSGLSDLNQIQLLFNSSATRLGGCNVFYKASTGTIYLYNDDGSAFVGAVTPGSPSPVSNSQCTLNGVGSSFTGSGNNLTLNVNITFLPSFTGQQNAYAYVQGNNGLNNGGWVQEGVWTH